MISNQVLISTPIAIVSIVAIVAVYLLVLKRNGWIGGKSVLEESPARKSIEDRPIVKIQPAPTTVERKAALPKIDKKEPEIRAATPPIIFKKEAMPIKKSVSIETNEPKKDIPEGCSHFFGYLWSLPKGTATPDACYLCFKLIDCYKEPKES
ncbi:MAG TPA: hypothetical protein VK253_01975 [Candidatus Binatia bacterium]|nr:hypothetical protein [Candidatus Binatia bacterium]